MCVCVVCACVRVVSILSMCCRYDQVDMVTSQSLWLERGRPLIPDLVRETPRVGIDSAGERWAGALLRFHLGDCRYVSKARRRNDISS